MITVDEYEKTRKKTEDKSCSNRISDEDAVKQSVFDGMRICMQESKDDL